MIVDLLVWFLIQQMECDACDIPMQTIDVLAFVSERAFFNMLELVVDSKD